jgi:hypothetical protein
MPRTYVPAVEQAVMVLTCSHCDRLLRVKVPVDPASWPLHRCGHNSTIIRPFDQGERAIT